MPDAKKSFTLSAYTMHNKLILKISMQKFSRNALNETLFNFPITSKVCTYFYVRLKNWFFHSPKWRLPSHFLLQFMWRSTIEFTACLRKHWNYCYNHLSTLTLHISVGSIKGTCCNFNTQNCNYTFFLLWFSTSMDFQLLFTFQLPARSKYS